VVRGGRFGTFSPAPSLKPRAEVHAYLAPDGDRQRVTGAIVRVLRMA
jgi:hypothetical protein